MAGFRIICIFLIIFKQLIHSCVYIFDVNVNSKVAKCIKMHHFNIKPVKISGRGTPLPRPHSPRRLRRLDSAPLARPRRLRRLGSAPLNFSSTHDAGIDAPARVRSKRGHAVYVNKLKMLILSMSVALSVTSLV